MDKRTERVVSVKDIFRYVFRHYIFVLVFAFAGAIVLIGGCYIKSLVQNEENRELTKEDLEKKYGAFTPDERANISYALYSYDRVKEMEQYIEETPYMKIQPQHVLKTTIQYRIELDNENELSYEEKIQRLNELVSAYNVYIKDGGAADKIAEESLLKETYSAKDINQFLAAGYDSMLEVNSTFCVYIEGADVIEGLDDAIKDVLVEYSENSDMHKHKLIIINESSITYRDDDIYSFQRYMYTERVSSSDRLKNAISALSGESLDYYNQMVKIKEAEDSGESDENLLNYDNNLKNIVSVKTALKYGVFGCVVGIIGAFCVLIFKYIFSSKVVADSDYTATMGMKLLGKISKSNIEKTAYLIATKVKFLCAKSNIKKVAIISSDITCIEKEIQESIQDTMEKMDIQVEIIGAVLDECDEMSRLLNIGNCVLVEKTNVSNYNKVFNLAQFCRENEINNIGVVDIIK